MEVKKKNRVLKRLLAGLLAVCVVGTGIPDTPFTFGLLKPVAASAEKLDISDAEAIVDEDNNYSVTVTLNDEVVSSDNYTVSYQKYYNGWTDVTAISGGGQYRAVVTAKSDSDYYGTVYDYFDIPSEFLINKYPAAVNNARAGQSDDLVLAGDVEDGYIIYSVDDGDWGSQDVIPTSESLSVGEHHVYYKIYEDDSSDTLKEDGVIDVYVHHPSVVKTVNGVSVQNARSFTLDQNFLDNDCFTAVNKSYLSGNIEFNYTLLTSVETQTGYATDDKAFSFWYINDGSWTRISDDNVEFYANWNVDDGRYWVITDSNAESERVYAFEWAYVGNMFKITGCDVDSAEYAAYGTNWRNIKSYYNNNNNSYPDDVVLVRVPLGTIIDTTGLTKVKDFREIPPSIGSYEGADAYDYYIAKTNNSNVVVKIDPIPSAKTFTLVDNSGAFGTKNIEKSGNTFTVIGTNVTAIGYAVNVFVNNTLTPFTEANGFVEVTGSLTDDEKLIDDYTFSHYYVYTGAENAAISVYQPFSAAYVAGLMDVTAITNKTSVDIEYLDEDFLDAESELSTTKLKKAIGVVDAGTTLGSTTVVEDKLHACFIIAKEDLSKKVDISGLIRIYPECFAADEDSAALYANLKKLRSVYGYTYFYAINLDDVGLLTLNGAADPVDVNFAPAEMPASVYVTKIMTTGGDFITFSDWTAVSLDKNKAYYIYSTMPLKFTGVSGQYAYSVEPGEGETGYKYWFKPVANSAAGITVSANPSVNMSVAETTEGSKQFDRLILDDNNALVATLTSGNAYYGESVSADVQWAEGYVPDENGSITALGVTDVAVNYSYAVVGAVGNNGAVSGTSAIIVSEYYDTFDALCDAKGIDTIEELYSTKYSVKAAVNYKYKNNQKNVSLNTFFNYERRPLNLVNVSASAGDYKNGVFSKTFDGVAVSAANFTLTETSLTDAFGNPSATPLPFGVNDYELVGCYAGENSVNSIIDAGEYEIVYKGKGNYTGTVTIPVTIEKATYPHLALNQPNKTYGVPYTISDFACTFNSPVIETETAKTELVYEFSSAKTYFVKFAEFTIGGENASTADEIAAKLAKIKDADRYSVKVHFSNPNYESTTLIGSFTIERKKLTVTLPKMLSKEYGTIINEDDIAKLIEVTGFAYEEDTEENHKALAGNLIIPGINVPSSTDSITFINSDVVKNLNVGTYPLSYDYKLGYATTEKFGEPNDSVYYGSFTIDALKFLNNYTVEIANGTATTEGTTEVHDSVLTVTPKKLNDFIVEIGLLDSYTYQFKLLYEDIKDFAVYVNGDLIAEMPGGDVNSGDKYTFSVTDSNSYQIKFAETGNYTITVIARGNYTGSAFRQRTTTGALDPEDYVFTKTNKNGDPVWIEPDEEDGKYYCAKDYDGRNIKGLLNVMACDEADYLVALTDETITYSYYKNTGSVNEPSWEAVTLNNTVKPGEYMVIATVNKPGYVSIRLDPVYVQVSKATLTIVISDYEQIYGEEPEDLSYSIKTDFAAMPSFALYDMIGDSVEFFIGSYKINPDAEVTGYPEEVGKYALTAKMREGFTNENFEIEFEYTDEYTDCSSYHIVPKDIAEPGNMYIKFTVDAATYSVGSENYDWIVNGYVPYSDGVDEIIKGTIKAEYLKDSADEAERIPVELVWVNKTLIKEGEDENAKYYKSFYLIAYDKITDEANERPTGYTGRTPEIRVYFDYNEEMFEAAIASDLAGKLNVAIAGDNTAAAGRVKFNATRSAVTDINVKAFGVKVLYCNGADITEDFSAETIRTYFTGYKYFDDEANDFKFKAPRADGTANAKTPAITLAYNVTAPGSKGTWGIAYATVEYKGKEYTLWSEALYQKAKEEVVKIENDVQITSVVYDSTYKTLKFVNKSIHATGKKFVQVGILASPATVITNENNIDNDLTLGSDKVSFTRFKKDDQVAPYSIYMYDWTKSNVNYGDIWYARPFMIVEGGYGIRYVVYGKAVRAEAGVGYSPVSTRMVSVPYTYFKENIANSDNSVGFVTVSAIPEVLEATMTKVGVIATKDETTAQEGLTIDTTKVSGVTFVKENTQCVGYKGFTYTWTKTGAVGQTWYIRPYFVYTDTNGEHLVYGEMVRTEN